MGKKWKNHSNFEHFSATYAPPLKKGTFGRSVHRSVSRTCPCRLRHLQICQTRLSRGRVRSPIVCVLYVQSSGSCEQVLEFVLMYLAGICSKMPPKCIVAGCSNTTKDGVSLHLLKLFPKDVIIRKLWTASKPKVKLTRAKWLYPATPCSVICSAHSPARRGLKPDAVPIYLSSNFIVMTKY